MTITSETTERLSEKLTDMAMGRKQRCDRLSWVVVLALAGALNASVKV
ncbi:hypothetical protein OGM63_11270 [Plectonema radiosum NIES-515]|uniref:H repeat-associated protein N-terminal domain-containing protein n=1 Tax=Plectonema radiosum NIES-515 TaxID=2986073 RepID=A0ABT3AY78_9CYAN|nr:hypothetical protein [Plectonema radiosum]MCV3214084.1 hypothetical protein [Plectonema radiosum NIES-515]